MTPPSPDGPVGKPVGGRALPAHFREKSPLTDTAGVSWSGRDYAPSPFPGDDGSTPPQVAAAQAAVGAGEDPHRQALVAALAPSRLLVPIMAVATEEGTTAHGLTGDNGADMAMVSITAPDGTRVLPVFTSAAALTAWRADARPVPVLTPQAAQAAVQEGCTALLLDAAGDPAAGGAVLLPRSVLWALAQGRDWVPPHEDGDLAAELSRIAATVPPVVGLKALPGERSEVDLLVGLPAGLDAAAVQDVTARLGAALGESMLVADRISSLRLRLAQA